MKHIRVIILMMMMIDIHCQNVKSISAVYYRKYDDYQLAHCHANDPWRSLTGQKANQFNIDYNTKTEISTKAVDHYLQSARCCNYLKIVFSDKMEKYFHMRGNILVPEKGITSYYCLKQPCSYYFADYTDNIEPDTGDVIQRHIRKIDSLKNLGK